MYAIIRMLITHILFDFAKENYLCYLTWYNAIKPFLLFLLYNFPSQITELLSVILGIKSGFLKFCFIFYLSYYVTKDKTRVSGTFRFPGGVGEEMEQVGVASQVLDDATAFTKFQT
jgi:hypothetical protein